MDMRITRQDLEAGLALIRGLDEYDRSKMAHTHTWLWDECFAVAERIERDKPEGSSAVSTDHLAQRIQDVILEALEGGEL